MKPSETKYWQLVEESISKRNERFVGFADSNEFNRVVRHIYSLLRDSYLLLTNGSYNTSIFLTVSAIEECAKAEIGIFRKTATTIVKRHADPMFSHEQKHIVAASPIVLIGERLKHSIGKERVNEIFEGLWNGKYKNIREDAIYFKRDENHLHIPRDAFSKLEAKELLLTAIEICDDRLVGWTSETQIFEEDLNSLFQSTELF